MNHRLSLSEIIEKIPLSLADPDAGNVPGELVATLESHFDEVAHEVVAGLDAHVCPDEPGHLMEHLRPAWLPERQTVRAGGAAEEASDMARDIFHSWVRRVRQSVPRGGQST